MTYTDKKPTAPGWYWCRLDETDKWIVIYFDGSKATKCGGTVEIDIANFPDGQFAGPIPEPGINPVDAVVAMYPGVDLDAEAVRRARAFCDEHVCAKCGTVPIKVENHDRMTFCPKCREYLHS